MRVLLGWDGGIRAALALDRLLGEGADVALVLERGPLDLLLEEQAAALRLPVAPGPATPVDPLRGADPRKLAEEAAASLRAFVWWCRPPLDDAWLGRFLDATALADLAALGVEPAAPDAPARTLVLDGPRFSRRVEAMASDIVPEGEGWRLELGLRGC